MLKRDINPGAEQKIGAFEIALVFMAARLILIISLPLDGLKSFGDFWNFFYQAGLGIPYLDYWTEFPPIFPFSSRMTYMVVGGREHSYILLMTIFLSIFQALNVYLFTDIIKWVRINGDILPAGLFYAFITLSLFYTWAYLDVLAVFCLLFGLSSILKGKVTRAGVILGAGGLIKWFPLLILPAAWKWLGTKKALKLLLTALLLLLAVWGMLYIISPEYTSASLISQGAKGSWETVWAIIDGNLGTGNFSAEIDRLDPASAAIASGNPALIPSWLTLIIFGGIGFFLLHRIRMHSSLDLIRMIGLTILIFFVWSPGYSPQWILFILPFPLMVFDRKKGWLITMILLLVSLLEWPILLSRGWFHLLEEIVIIRTVIFILVGILFYQTVPKSYQETDEVDVAGR